MNEDQVVAEHIETVSELYGDQITVWYYVEGSDDDGQYGVVMAVDGAVYLVDADGCSVSGAGVRLDRTGAHYDRILEFLKPLSLTHLGIADPSVANDKRRGL